MKYRVYVFDKKGHFLHNTLIKAQDKREALEIAFAANSAAYDLLLVEEGGIIFDQLLTD